MNQPGETISDGETIIGGGTITDPGPPGLSRRERIEAELRRLRRQLADAWWYEKPLETIQKIERLIAARTGDLDRLP